MLEVINIKKSYGDKLVLNGINFNLNKGEIVCLLGKNGVGKSTLIKIIIGILKKDSGEIKINNIDINSDEIKYKMSFGYVPDEFNAFDYLTGFEYFNFIINIYKINTGDTNKRLDYLIDLFDIREYINKKIETYSKGTKQKIMIIASILHNPKVLILDEPFNGLDIETIEITKRLFKEFVNQGNIIIFSTHIIEIVKNISNRVIVLNNANISIDLDDKFINENFDNLEDLFLKTIDS